MSFLGPDNKEGLVNITTAWDGIRQVIQQRYEQGSPLSFSMPVHPSRNNPMLAANSMEMLVDAFCGEYGGVKSIVRLNEYLIVDECQADAFFTITDWIDWQVETRGGKKIPHQMVFEYILDVYEGDVGFALRDTMLYFHALSRESRMLGEPGVMEQQQKRERFILNHIMPISEEHPFPRGYGFWPNEDLRNRVGEYYHQYWLIYLSMYFNPKTIGLMLNTENAMFGIFHGSIKKAMDRRLVGQLNEVQSCLAGLPELQ